MAALSTSTYGKGTTMESAALADRMTACLESAYPALDTLDRSNLTGAVADQGAVNTLRKVIQDLGAIAGDARKAASDEAVRAADEKAAAAAPQSGTMADSTNTTGPAKGSTAGSTAKA